ncbi:MAG TPA: hypothetical protein VK982_15725, partial [Bacteroidales bacterium]|nr:hypothetical protein [Bacteroidales bacterium]
SAIIIVIVSIGFILPNANLMKTASAVTIECTGDSSRICARGTTSSGGSWELTGDKGVIKTAEIASES